MLQCLLKACGDSEVFLEVMIGLFKIWEVSWDTHRTFLQCKRLHIQCQFQEPSQILQHCFYQVFSTGHDWITLQRMVPQHILLTFPYRSKHKPPQTDLISIISNLLYLSVWNLSSNLILQCLWLKACGGLKGLSCDMIVFFLRYIKFYTTLSVRRIITHFASFFDWKTLQRMVCQHILLTCQYGSKHKPPQTNPHHLKLATWFCNVS